MMRGYEKLLEWASRRVAPTIVPTFSSNIRRRMTVLRSIRGSVTGGRRSALGIVAAAAIATIGAGTMALRSEAEQDVAAPVTVPHVPGAFEAAPVDLSFMGSEALVTAVLRPHLMAKRDVLKPLIDAVDKACLEGVAAFAKGGPWPEFDVEKIDFIVYQVRQMEDESEDACNVAIRYVDPTPVAQWMLDHVAGAESATEGGMSYVRVRREGSPEPSVMLAQRDERTIVISDKVVGLQRMVSGEATGASDRTWKSVGGGLAMIAVDGSKWPGGYHNFMADFEFALGVPSGQPDPFRASLATIYKEAKVVRIGLDLDPTTQLLMVRGVLNCTDEVAAKRVRECVEFYLAFVKEYLRVSLSDPAALAAVPEEHRMYVDALLLVVKLVADAKMELRPQQDEGVDVFVEMAGEAPKSIWNFWTALRPVYAEVPVYAERPEDAADANAEVAPAE